MKGRLYALLFLLLSVFSAAGDIRLTEPGQPVVIGGKGVVFSEKPFSPLDLPGLAAWYSADYGVLTSVSPDVAATEGQTVRRWLDRSGNGRHLDQTVLANQPTLSQGELVFDGITSVMSSGALTVDMPCAFFFVLKQASWTSARFIFDTRTSGLRASLVQRIISPQICANGDIAVNSGATLGDYCVVSAVFNGSTATVRVNSLSSSGSHSTLAGTQLTIGAVHGGASAYAEVSFKEILYVGSLLDEATQAKVRQYLARKWGISL